MIDIFGKIALCCLAALFLFGVLEIVMEILNRIVGNIQDDGY